MKVAITGGNGFLTRYLVAQLKELGSTPVLLSRNSGQVWDIPFAVTDYSEVSLCEIFNKSGGIDALIHLAGPRKAVDSIAFYNNFFDMTHNLYEAAAKTGVKNIIFASSISVYSGENMPYREDMVPEPKNNYGISKLVGEHIGNIYCSQFGIAVKNYRFAHMYGANENNNYMINKFFRQAYNHEQITVNCKSYARREMLYTRDAVSAILQGLAHPEISGIYNIGSGEALTNEEIAKYICTEMSPELQVNLGTEQETIVSSWMSGNKAKAELGYAPHYTLQTALKEIHKDMQVVMGE